MQSSYSETNLPEKSGIIQCTTPWGRWWQTITEVHIEIDVPYGTKARSIKINSTSSHISAEVSGNNIFNGTLYSTIIKDETIWTLEDKKVIYIVLTKALTISNESIWKSLLKDCFKVNEMTLREMRNKLDLEKYQIENPGFDFSDAQFSNCYDKGCT